MLSAAAHPRTEADLRAQDAWAELYRAYCYPVYAFIRRNGYPRPQAQDLTQDFFVHLLERGTLGWADPARGRLRTFLLGALEYFLAEVARWAASRERGGHCRFVFLDDAGAAEHQYQLTVPAWETPERLFDARWGTALLDVVFLRLREEMARAGKQPLFEALQGYVAGTEDRSYHETADALGLSLSNL